MSSNNYFESAEWQETKKAIDEKIKSKKPEHVRNKTHNPIFGEGAINVKIDWELVKLFNTRGLK